MRRNPCDIVGAALGKNKRKMAGPGLMEWLVAADKKETAWNIGHPIEVVENGDEMQQKK
jgi:hypothetical protein